MNTSGPLTPYDAARAIGVRLLVALAASLTLAPAARAQRAADAPEQRALELAASRYLTTGDSARGLRAGALRLDPRRFVSPGLVRTRRPWTSAWGPESPDSGSTAAPGIMNQLLPGHDGDHLGALATLLGAAGIHAPLSCPTGERCASDPAGFIAFSRGAIKGDSAQILVARRIDPPSGRGPRASSSAHWRFLLVWRAGAWHVVDVLIGMT
jgi:hypothetical protein